MSEDYVPSKRRRWVVRISRAAENTFNPIRDVVDSMKIVPNPDYELIRLTVGDPTVFGNLPPSERCVQAFCEKIKSGEDNGYHLAHGCLKAREAVARYCSTAKVSVNAEDVILSSGCSGAIDLAIDVLTDPGDNILIPRPGFSLYKCLSGSKGIETRSYKLIPERCWEADLEHMESLIDDRTRVIIVVNPSNPCGCVYTKEHLQTILAVAEKHQVPIISDEVYAFCTFRDRQFYSMGPLSKTVPVLTVGGIAKRFLVPGWRLGWVVIHDRNEAFGHEVRAGLRRLSQRILGPCAPLQATLPIILTECRPDFFEKTLTLMKKVSDIFYNTLSRIPELYPVKPYGAMYMLIGVNVDRLTEIKNDVDFTQRLVSEKSVFCLPAKCFECPNFFRVVLTCPENIAQEACLRIADFCKDHRIPSTPAVASSGKIIAENALATMAATPVLMIYGKQTVPLAGKLAIGVTIILAGTSTTFLLHWVTKVYVHRMFYNATTETFTVETMNLLARRKETECSLDEIRLAKEPTAFTTFQAKGKKYFLHTDLLEAQQVLQFIREHRS